MHKVEEDWVKVELCGKGELRRKMILQRLRLMCMWQ